MPVSRLLMRLRDIGTGRHRSMLNVFIAVLALLLMVALTLLRSKLASRAQALGRRHAVPPGPRRVVLGLLFASVFVVCGVLTLVLPSDPWASGGMRQFVPWGAYGLVLIPCGVALAGLMIGNRDVP